MDFVLSNNNYNPNYPYPNTFFQNNPQYPSPAYPQNNPEFQNPQYNPNMPEMIYPKNDSQRSREDILAELIEKSPKKRILLQIIPMRYDKNLIGYVFKFTELNQKKLNSDINKSNSVNIRYNEKREVMFDVKRLGYIRTFLVEQKTGFYHNLREEENEEKEGSEASKKSGARTKKKTKDKDDIANIKEESSEDEDKKEIGRAHV